MIFLIFLSLVSSVLLSIGIFCWMKAYNNRHEGATDANTFTGILGVILIAGAIGCIIGAGSVARELSKDLPVQQDSIEGKESQ